MEQQLVLASTSPYRRQLLDRLGVPYRSVAPRCDEAALRQPGMEPAALALLLARAKAESVCDDHPGAFVLGSDQVIEIDGDILGKPGTREAALRQLERLAGRTHRIVTAIVLRYPDGTRAEHVDTHAMVMRPLPTATLARYVDADEPFDCAGSYKIESRGYFLFEAVEGRDHTAVIGLPLLAVTSVLARAGFSVPP